VAQDGVTAPRFADSPLEGGGFELSVPRHSQAYAERHKPGVWWGDMLIKLCC
jgi:hypothetical protein